MIIIVSGLLTEKSLFEGLKYQKQNTLNHFQKVIWRDCENIQLSGNCRAIHVSIICREGMRKHFLNFPHCAR